MTTQAPTQQPATDCQTIELPVVRPAFNTKQLDDALEVGIALPGVAKNDITVDFDNGVLTVEAVRSFDAPGDQLFVRREIDDTRFVLKLRVADTLDTSRVSASLDNGILALRLPVREESKPRKIEIN